MPKPTAESSFLGLGLGGFEDSVRSVGLDRSEHRKMTIKTKTIYDKQKTCETIVKLPKSIPTYPKEVCELQFPSSFTEISHSNSPQKTTWPTVKHCSSLGLPALFHLVPGPLSTCATTTKPVAPLPQIHSIWHTRNIHGRCGSTNFANFLTRNFHSSFSPKPLTLQAVHEHRKIELILFTLRAGAIHSDVVPSF